MEEEDDSGNMKEEGELSEDGEIFDKIRDELLERSQNESESQPAKEVKPKVLSSAMNLSEERASRRPLLNNSTCAENNTLHGNLYDLGDGDTFIETKQKSFSLVNQKLPDVNASAVGSKRLSSYPRKPVGSRRSPSPRWGTRSRAPDARSRRRGATRRDRLPPRDRSIERRRSARVKDDYSRAVEKYRRFKNMDREVVEPRKRGLISPTERHRNSLSLRATEGHQSPDDDDLEELSLRRLALQSAARNDRKEATRNGSIRIFDRAIDSASKQRPRSSSSGSPTNMSDSSLKRRKPLATVWEPPAPGTGEAPLLANSESNESSNDLLRTILSLEGPNQQLKAFLDYVVDKAAFHDQDKLTLVEHLKQFASLKEDAVTSGLESDDYESVAMDIDSDTNSNAHSLPPIGPSPLIRDTFVDPNKIPLPPPPPLPTDAAPPLPPQSPPPPPGTEAEPRAIGTLSKTPSTDFRQAEMLDGSATPTAHAHGPVQTFVPTPPTPPDTGCYTMSPGDIAVLTSNAPYWLNPTAPQSPRIAPVFNETQFAIQSPIKSTQLYASSNQYPPINAQHEIRYDLNPPITSITHPDSYAVTNARRIEAVDQSPWQRRQTVSSDAVIDSELSAQLFQAYEPYVPTMTGVEDYHGLSYVYNPTPTKPDSLTSDSGRDVKRRSAEDVAAEIIAVAKSKSATLQVSENVGGGDSDTSKKRPACQKSDEGDDENLQNLRNMVLQSLGKRRLQEPDKSSCLTDGLLALPSRKPALWRNLLPDASPAGHGRTPVKYDDFGDGDGDDGGGGSALARYECNSAAEIPSAAASSSSTSVLSASSQQSKSGKRRRRPSDYRRMMRRKWEREAKMAASVPEVSDSRDWNSRSDDDKSLDEEVCRKVTIQKVKLPDSPVRCSDYDFVPTIQKVVRNTAATNVADVEAPKPTTRFEPRKNDKFDLQRTITTQARRPPSGARVAAVRETMSMRRNISPMTIRLEDTPQHDPVIISLGYDTDDSDRETYPDKAHPPAAAKATNTLKPSSLDQFLSNMRQQVQLKTSTPHASFSDSKLSCDVTQSRDVTCTADAVIEPGKRSGYGIDLGRTPGIDLEMEKRTAILNRMRLKREENNILPSPELVTETVTHHSDLKEKVAEKIKNVDASGESGRAPGGGAGNLCKASVTPAPVAALVVADVPVSRSPVRTTKLDDVTVVRARLPGKRESPPPPRNASADVENKSAKSNQANHEQILKNVSACEDQLKKYRLSIARDEMLFVEERRRLDEKKVRFVDTLSIVEKLREQLAASERVLASLDGQVQVHEKKMKNMLSNITIKRKASNSLRQKIAMVEKFFESQRAGTNQSLKRKMVDVTDSTKSSVSDLKKSKSDKVAETGSPHVRLLTQKNGLNNLQQVLSKKLLEYKQLSVSMSKCRLASSESFNHLTEADVIPLHVSDGGLLVTKPAEIVCARRSVNDLDKSTVPKLETVAPSVIGVGNDRANASAASVDQLQRASGAAQDAVSQSDDRASPVIRMPKADKKKRLAAIYMERLKKETIRKAKWSDVCRIPSLEPDVKELPFLRVDKRTKPKNPSQLTFTDYKSPLRAFRGFRLHRFYRTREELAIHSATFSHALRPKVALCRFALNGTCNDQKCRWQHESDYSMTIKDVLQDLLAYSPKLAGCLQSTNVQQYNKLISDYVDSFYKEHQAVLNADQLCVLVASRVNDSRQCKHPNTLPLAARRWAPTCSDRLANLPAEAEPLSEFPPSDADRLAHPSASSYPSANNDERYFPVNGDVAATAATDNVVVAGLSDVETLVLDQPHNTKLWLQLAHSKLADKSSDGNDSQERALNVLSRGLERNRDNEELWLLYLHLYARRSDQEHLLMLCEQAATFTQSYQVWFKYMELCEGYDAKRTVCDRVLAMLADSSRFGVQARSHCILETVLYVVSLANNVQHTSTAVQLFKKYLYPGSDCRLTSDHVTLEDRVLAWLCYLHLVAQHDLPRSLFAQDSGSNPGRLVDKTPILCDWSSIKSSTKVLAAIFQQALNACSGPIDVILPLYRNYFRFEVHSQREAPSSQRVAEGRMSELVGAHAQCVELWLCYAECVLSIHGHQRTVQILESALEKTPHCPLLYHFWASLQLQAGEESLSLELLERAIMTLYQTDSQHAQHADPNFLYRCYLGLEFTLSVPPPALRPDVNVTDVDKYRVYVWLNYALLLQLQGDQDEAPDVYETALSRLDQQHHVQLVWISYLSFKRHVVTERTGHQLTALVRRCLLSSPCRCSLPYSPGEPMECHYGDYSFHSHVARFYLDSLSRDQKMEAYAQLVDLMPENVAFRESYVSYLEEHDSAMAAMESSRAILYDNIPSLSIASSALYHTLQDGGTPSEMRKLLRHATQLMPYTSSLWKNWVLYEVVTGSEDTVRTVLRRAALRGIQLGEFVNKVLS